MSNVFISNIGRDGDSAATSCSHASKCLGNEDYWWRFRATRSNEKSTSSFNVYIACFRKYIGFLNDEQETLSRGKTREKRNACLSNKTLQRRGSTYLANEFKCFNQFVGTTDVPFDNQFNVCSTFSSQKCDDLRNRSLG